MTWGRETRDLGTLSMGRGDVWDGDAGDVNEYCKSLINAISLSL